ncbi:MAG: T9SS type A sorting domain-containing protein, partial [Calditrichaeota bacterium]|nr:T9SS type A sorting domain-containing protein [Calditrichota bacterium]
DYPDGAIFSNSSYEYRLSSVDSDGQKVTYPQIVRVNVAAGSIEDFQLYANYPNPFNGETNIRFRIGEPTKTTLVVYDINGRVVKTIFSGELNQGEHIYRWDATDNLGNTVASGFYLVRLRTDNFYKSVKMILAR